MDDKTKHQINVSESEIMNMLGDISKLAVKQSASQLSSIASAVPSNALTDNVEFWKWMGRNFSHSGIFDSASSMQQRFAQVTNQKGGLFSQLQGKGYEWEWMSAQRNMPENIFKTYDAGDIANRAATDVTERNLLTGELKDYQMKAYTSKTSPKLSNTPKDVTIVTNAEQTGAVRAKGYENVNEFQNSEKIRHSTRKRLDQIREGKAYTSYNLKNVTGTMAKAGLLGSIIGIGIEAVASYRDWKRGDLSDQGYLKEILKAGGDAGVTSAVTSGIMIPVSAAITVAGASTLLTFPIAFVFGTAVSKIVAPCFGRGEYKEILSEAKYYQSLERITFDLMVCMENASKQYYEFLVYMAKQNANHQKFKQVSMKMNEELRDLYDSI